METFQMHKPSNSGKPLKWQSRAKPHKYYIYEEGVETGRRLSKGNLNIPMIEVQSRPQTAMVTKVIVVRKSLSKRSAGSIPVPGTNVLFP